MGIKGLGYENSVIRAVPSSFSMTLFSDGNTFCLGNTEDIRRHGRDSLNALEAGDAMRPNHLPSLPLRQRRSSSTADATRQETCLSNLLIGYSCIEDTIFVVSNHFCVVDLFQCIVLPHLRRCAVAVSYTHLTLPTILRV